VLGKIARRYRLILRRIKAHQLRGCGIEHAGGNFVTRERIANLLPVHYPRRRWIENLVLQNRAAESVRPDLAAKKPGEVASCHGLCRNGEETAVTEVLNGAAAGRDARALVVAENEKLVFDDRTADGAAELILLKDVARRPGLVVFPTVRVQLIVLKNFENHAVNLVGTRFQVNIDDAAGGAAVFGVVAIGEDLHGANGFDRRVNDERL